MHASLLLALTQAALVTVAPGPSDICPSSAQISAALGIHAPRLVSSRPSENPAMQVTLVLSPPLATGEMSIYLLDKIGLVKLYRTLPALPGSHARDCSALADTVALIIDRYFEDIGLPALPEKTRSAPPRGQPGAIAPPPAAAQVGEAPRLVLSLRLGRRIPGDEEDMGGNEVTLGVAVRLTRARLPGDGLWIEGGAGVAGVADRDLRTGARITGRATVIRSLVEVAVHYGWAFGRGRIYVGPLTTLDLIWLDANSDGRSQHESRVAFAAGLRTGYQYFWANHFFARADLSGQIAVLRYEVASQSDPSIPIFANPRGFFTLTLGIGFWF